MVRDRRRSRRRRAVGREVRHVVVVGAAAAVVVVLAAGAVASVGPASVTFHRTLAAGFAALASPIAVRSDATGTELQAATAGVGATTRPALFAALDRLATDAADEAGQMDAAGSPPTAGGASRGCVAAMDARATATATIRDALEGLLGGPTGTGGAAGDQPSAVRALTGAGSLLVGADSSWAACRSALRAQSGAARMPASAWVPDAAAWATDAVTAYVATFAVLPGLAPAPALAITVVTPVPAPVVNGPGPGVVPTTSSLVLHVVVSNNGNVDEAGMRVSATATPLGSPAGAGATSVQGPALDVASGQAATVTLPGLGVQAGRTYAVTVTALDASGAGRASDAFTIMVAAPPPTTTTTTTTTAPARTTTTVPGRTTTTVRHASGPARGGRGGTAGPSAP